MRPVEACPDPASREPVRGSSEAASNPPSYQTGKIQPLPREGLRALPRAIPQAVPCEMQSPDLTSRSDFADGREADRVLLWIRMQIPATRRPLWDRATPRPRNRPASRDARSPKLPARDRAVSDSRRCCCSHPIRVAGAHFFLPIPLASSAAPANAGHHQWQLQSGLQPEQENGNLPPNKHSDDRCPPQTFPGVHALWSAET